MENINEVEKKEEVKETQPLTLSKMQFLILMVGVILIFATCSLILFKVATHLDELSNDPLVYGAQLYNVTSCSCLVKNTTLYFDQDKVWRIQKQIAPKENNPFANFELNATGNN